MRRTLLSAATLLLALPAAAQGPVSTGVFAAGRDVNWDVAVGSGPFVDAFQVSANPGWGDFSGPTAARWISYNTTATGPGGAPYRFRTMFDLTGFDVATASLTFRCGMDDVVEAIRLNGLAATVSGGSCTFHALSPNLTLASGFAAGMNTLEFQVNGNQATDGFIYHTVDFSAVPLATVPEPSTWALLATGLAGVAGAARRRRTAA